MNAVKEYGFETGFGSTPFGELQQSRNKSFSHFETVSLRAASLKNLTASQYLSSVEPFFTNGLISEQNYTDMKRFASSFSGRITSFFGFESRLNSPEQRADYLFAVSSRNGERDALAAQIQNGQLPKEFMNKPEWQNASRFVLQWANPQSILYNNVLGLWFEFDMIENSKETPVPCVFIHAAPFQIKSSEDATKCAWITKTALPLLTGHEISEKLEQRFIDCITKLPQNARLFDIGAMLSRTTSRIRLVINRITAQEIIPYLQSLGWTDENNGLQSLLNDVEKLATRVVLHISITEDGVEQKIGLECAFHPDLYNFETRWEAFFDYLVKKNVCLPEKKEAMLQFMGVEQEDSTQEFNLNSYVVSAKIPDNNYSSALVRYISHIKLVYKPKQPLEAKAYPGVRLFGTPKKSTSQPPAVMY
jgi:hypothetical protein